MGKVILDEGWDSSIKFNQSVNQEETETKAGFFAGRQREVDILSNDIARKREGSILIRGYPGVGKTSLVLKSLQNSVAMNDNIIVVFLSGPDMLEDRTLDPESMIKHLARRLYVYSKERNLGDINNDIETFYYKSVSKSTDTLTTQAENSIESESEIETNFRAKLSSKPALMKAGFYLAPFALGSILAYDPRFQEFPFIPVVGSLVLLFMFHLGYQSYSGERKQRRVTRKAESTYEKDSTLGNLKFDLNKIHRELTDKRIVYVVDELDKVKFNDAIQVLEFFKDFFTSSNALFIFVAGENFKPQEFTGAQDADAHRPRSYTYFNSQYFIPRPRRDDLFEYLYEIAVEYDVSDDELKNLFGSICFDAKNDFFDLKTRIKNRIEDFDEFAPVLEPRDSDETKANMYQAISLYEDRYSADPLDWEVNEQIARTLFEIGASVNDGHIGQELQDPSGNKVWQRLARDFHQFLYRHGVLDIENTEPKQIDGMEVEVNTYSIKRTELETSPTAVDEPTEFEREFIQKFERLCGYHLPLINILRSADGSEELSFEDTYSKPISHLKVTNSVGLESSNQIRDHYKLYKQITQRKIQSLGRDKVESQSNALDSMAQHYLNNSLPSAYAKAFNEIVRDPNAKVARLQNVQESIDSSIYEYFENENPFVVRSDSRLYKSPRTVIFSGQDPSESRRLLKALRKSKNYRIVTNSYDGRDRSSIYVLDTKSPESLINSSEEVVAKLQGFFVSAIEGEIENILKKSSVESAKNRLYANDVELLEFAFDFEKSNKNRTTMINWIGKKKRRLDK